MADTGIWLTGGLFAEEVVVVPFKQVIWCIIDWTGKTVFFGDDNSLIIMDPVEKRVHMLDDRGYVCHTITAVLGGEQGRRFKLFIIDNSNFLEAHEYSAMTPLEKLNVRRLASACARSERWLLDHKVV